ncbi:uncharacterized protein LOC134786658 [Penaeus indicus]|uniref:uncharacterized protein LOC134786658 n=1 Tax=Penaeus indicus TaxID=29960 RepID=UPI00300D2712
MSYRCSLPRSSPSKRFPELFLRELPGPSEPPLPSLRVHLFPYPPWQPLSRETRVLPQGPRAAQTSPRGPESPRAALPRPLSPQGRAPPLPPPAPKSPKALLHSPAFPATRAPRFPQSPLVPFRPSPGAPPSAPAPRSARHETWLPSSRELKWRRCSPRVPSDPLSRGGLAVSRARPHARRRGRQHLVGALLGRARC